MEYISDIYKTTLLNVFLFHIANHQNVLVMTIIKVA